MVLQVHWAERSLSATNAKTQLVCLLRFEVSEQTDRLGILTHGGMVKTIIAIYRVGNLVMEKLAGHKTHRVRLKPGGFVVLPNEANLREFQKSFEQTVPRLQVLAEGFADFRRASESESC